MYASSQGLCAAIGDDEAKNQLLLSVTGHLETLVTELTVSIQYDMGQDDQIQAQMSAGVSRAQQLCAAAKAAAFEVSAQHWVRRF